MLNAQKYSSISKYSICDFGETLNCIFPTFSDGRWIMESISLRCILIQKQMQLRM